MKCGSTAIRPNSPTQLSRVSVITPSELVPALSSNCAAAFRSTPTIRNENPGQVMLLPADDDATNVAAELTHGDTCVSEPLVLVWLHDRVRLPGCVPTAQPFSLGRDRLVGLAGNAHRQFVVMLHLRHGAAKVVRQGLIVHPESVERDVGAQRTIVRDDARDDRTGRPRLRQCVVSG